MFGFAGLCVMCLLSFGLSVGIFALLLHLFGWLFDFAFGLYVGRACCLAFWVDYI